MKSITNLSIVSLLVCTTALCLHIGLEYYYKNELFAMDSDSVKQVAPLVAALISSLVLFSSSIKFKKYVMLCKSIEMPSTPKKNYRTAD